MRLVSKNKSSEVGIKSRKSCTRKKTGCSTCRKRHKKCDESKPKCSACNRLSLNCSYMKVLSWNSNNQVESRDGFFLVPSREVKLRGLNMINFTYNDIKLNSLLRNTLVVPRNDHKRISRQIRETFENSYNSEQMAELFKTKISEEEKLHLYNYYIDVVSKEKVFSDSSINEFRTIVIPNSVSSCALDSSIIALAANSMRKEQPLKAEHLQNVSTKFKHKAISTLYNMLDKDSALIEAPISSKLNEIVITMVILCSLEISIKGNRMWVLHLNAAGSIFNMLSSTLVRQFDVLFLSYRYFALRYILLTTTLNENEMGDFMTSTPFPFFEEFFTDNEIDYVYGCSPKLLGLIYKIRLLKQASSSIDRDQLIREIISIQNELSGLIQRQKDGEQNSFKLFRYSQAYLISSKIYFIDTFQDIVRSLYPINMRSSFFSQDNMDKLVSSSRLLLHQLSEDSDAENLFPLWCLFITGIVLTEEKAKYQTLSIFATLNSLWPYGTPSAIMEAVETVWKAKDLLCENVSLDWQDILSIPEFRLALT